MFFTNAFFLLEAFMYANCVYLCLPILATKMSDFFIDYRCRKHFSPKEKKNWQTGLNLITIKIRLKCGLVPGIF